jgi:hypothetical protein
MSTDSITDAAEGFFTGDVKSISNLAFGDVEGGVRSGKSGMVRQAQRAQDEQMRQIKERQKKEQQALAEAESDVKRRKALAQKGKAGRKSLIATSETGLAQNLGGTNGAA